MLTRRHSFHWHTVFFQFPIYSRIKQSFINSAFPIGYDIRLVLFSILIEKKLDQGLVFTSRCPPLFAKSLNTVSNLLPEGFISQPRSFISFRLGEFSNGHQTQLTEERMETSQIDIDVTEQASDQTEDVIGLFEITASSPEPEKRKNS